MTTRFGSRPPRCRRRPRCSGAKRSRARATIASSARSGGTVGAGSPVTGSAAGAELLRRVAEILDGSRRRLSPLELLAAAVHPDHRDVHLQERGDVGVIAAADVHPPLLASDPTRAL